MVEQKKTKQMSTRDVEENTIKFDTLKAILKIKLNVHL